MVVHPNQSILIHWKEVEDIFDCTSQCAEKQWCEILIGGLEQYQMEMFSVYIFTIILYDIHKVFQKNFWINLLICNSVYAITAAESWNC